MISDMTARRFWWVGGRQKTKHNFSRIEAIYIYMYIWIWQHIYAYGSVIEPHFRHFERA